MHRGWQLLFQTDSHLQENTCRLCRFKRAPAQSGSLIMIKKLQAGTGTGIKGSEMRPGSLSSPRGGSRLADSCGHPVHRVFNPKPSVCTGITKPTWGPLPPPIESWMPPSANAGTAPKCDHAFFLLPTTTTSHPAKGSATAPGLATCSTAHFQCVLESNVLHHARRPTTRANQPTHSLPSLKSVVQSRHSFPPF